MADPPIERLLREAPFVFRGRVEAANATTTAAMAASNRTAIVRVLEVVRAPAAFRRLRGQTVTVQLRQPGQPAAGQTAMFFARSQLLADSLVVEELAHRPVEEAASVAGLQDALVQHSNEQLAARLDQAEAVVIGQVSNVRPSTIAAATGDEPRPISEHDPQWWEAVVNVESTVKGATPSGPVVVLYPSSIDVAWYDAPKYHAGQRGVFLLHSAPVPRAAAESLGNVFMTLHPADFHDLEGEGRVRSLLGQSGRAK